MEFILPPSLLLYDTRLEKSITAASPEQLASVHWFVINVSVNYTYQEPPYKFNYCDLFFVMPSALVKFTKVKFTQNIIALRYLQAAKEI